MEHRCGHRRRIDIGVTLRTRNGLAASGRLRNVSASGALISTHLLLHEHAAVLVQFEHARPQRITVSAEVVRLTGDGFAVEWSDFAPEVIRELTRLTRRAPETSEHAAQASTPTRQRR